MPAAQLPCVPTAKAVDPVAMLAGETLVLKTAFSVRLLLLPDATVPKLALPREISLKGAFQFT